MYVYVIASRLFDLNIVDVFELYVEFFNGEM